VTADPAYHGHVIRTVRSPQDLAAVRAIVIDAATRAGIDPERAAKLALAVTEVAANALVHARTGADLEITVETGRIVVEVSDKGPGLPSDRPTDLVAVDQEHGRGLWLVRHLCDRVDILPTARGTRIALTMFRQTL
jgi:anti-sigma regulatory factor (Ser/Thr protein kinase)